MGLGMQWHQLDHMQTICTSLQTDNHTNTSSAKLKHNKINIYLQRVPRTAIFWHTP